VLNSPLWHQFSTERGQSRQTCKLWLELAGVKGGDEQQHRGWRDAPRFLTWAGVLFGVLVTGSVISKTVHAAGGPVAQGLVTYAGTAAFFWWTMHFLLAGRVPLRRLIRAAMVTALFWIGLELFSSAYFSATIISDSRLYGTIGVVFTLLTWFIAIGAVIVLGAVAGAPATSG
jgi:membrane protein